MNLQGTGPVDSFQGLESRTGAVLKVFLDVAKAMWVEFS
jgi:hypothetical protein